LTRLSDEFRKSLAAMAASYQASLQADSSGAEAARSYLSGRGISISAASQYQIGLVNSEFDEHASYAGWLCFPYMTSHGGAVSLKFRDLAPAGDGEKKYISPYPTRLYNPIALDAADRCGYVCICEGEFDTITLDALVGMPGECPAVGIPGVKGWTAHPEWKELFRGYRRVYVFADGDEPGQDMAKQILKDIDTASLIKLPAHDVNETYLKFGPNVIRERINA
jgi:DNA primase